MEIESLLYISEKNSFTRFISKSVLTIRFGLAKKKKRQAEANIFYPVCTIIGGNTTFLISMEIDEAMKQVKIN